MKHRNRHNSHSAEIKTRHPQREAGFSYLAPDQISIVRRNGQVGGFGCDEPTFFR